MGIILISFRMDDRMDPLLLSACTPLGADSTIPFFGTNVDTARKKEVCIDGDMLWEEEVDARFGIAAGDVAMPYHPPPLPQSALKRWIL